MASPASALFTTRSPLFALAQAVASAAPIDAIYETALACLSDSIPVERSAILLFDDDGVMRFKAWRGLGEEYRRAVEGHSPWSRDTRAPEPVIVHDVEAEPELQPLLPAIRAERIGALAFVPLSVGGKLLGKFMLYYAEPHTIPEDDVALAEAIANHVAFAIDQRHAREEHQLSVDLLAGQKRALELLAARVPLPHVLDSLVETIRHISNGECSATIHVLDASGAFREVAPTPEGRPSLYMDANGRFGAANGEALTQIEEQHGEASTGAVLRRPVLTDDGRVLGRFDISTGGSRALQARERLAVELLAPTAAIAIETTFSRSERRRHRDHLEAVFRSSIAGIAELDDHGRFVTVNDRFCELVGRTREDLSGLDFFALCQPAADEEIRDRFNALTSGAGDLIFEQQFSRRDGSFSWVDVGLSAISSSEGRPSGAVAIVTDVTERKLGEETLRRSEQFHRSFVEAMGIAAYTTDANGVLTMYNEAAAELWGRRPELGKERWCGSWRLYWPNGDPMDLSECPLGVAIRENRAVRGVEIVVERPDGSRAAILPYPTPLRDDTGNVIGAINVLIDITDVKTTEDALREAIRAKDDFLGQISHELRNPVTQLGGYAEMLVRRWQTLPVETQGEFLQEVHSQAVRVRRLVENMIVLSRFERGVMPGTEPHLIQRLLDDTLDEFCRRFPQTRLVIRVAEGLPPVDTSASTIDQVVWNLLTNAQKYGPSQGPIEIEAGLEDGWVQITVRDQGPGVPEEDLERIFEPYFRSASTPDHTAGLGLGLSVCKRLMEAQGGKMWARRLARGGMEFGVGLRALND